MSSDTTSAALIEAAETILRRANDAGMYLSDTPLAPTFAAIRTQARLWLESVDTVFATLSPGDALTIAVGHYDFVYRTAYNSPTPVADINRQVLRALDAHIAGDTSVDEYDLFRAIADGIERRDPAYLDHPLRWYTLTLERWHDQFRYGTNLHLLSDYDLNQRITLLQSSDLLAFEGANQSAFKRQLAEWGNSI